MSLSNLIPPPSNPHSDSSDPLQLERRFVCIHRHIINTDQQMMTDNFLKWVKSFLIAVHIHSYMFFMKIQNKGNYQCLSSTVYIVCREGGPAGTNNVSAVENTHVYTCVLNQKASTDMFLFGYMYRYTPKSYTTVFLLHLSFGHGQTSVCANLIVQINTQCRQWLRWLFATQLNPMTITKLFFLNEEGHENSLHENIPTNPLILGLLRM